MSQAGGSANYAPTYTAGKCPVGATGQGTAASPCVGVGSTCSATAALCVEQRYVDSYGNVIYYLAMMQTAKTAAAAVAAVKK